MGNFIHVNHTIFIFKWKKEWASSHTPNSKIAYNNAAYNEWQCHALAMGNWIENYKQISVIIGYTSLIHNCDTFFVKYQSSVKNISDWKASPSFMLIQFHETSTK